MLLWAGNEWEKSKCRGSKGPGGTAFKYTFRNESKNMRGKKNGLRSCSVAIFGKPVLNILVLRPVLINA
jgi:hypothetical protein